MTFEVGVGLPLTSASDVAEIGRRARIVEDAGLDAVSIPDILVGDGTPSVDALGVAAAVAMSTTRVRIEFGVLVPALRPVVTLASQIGTLQHLSGDRVVLGLGVGGFAGSPFWRAAGISATGRGAHLDTALRLLPDLIAGRETDVDGTAVTLGPPATVPPILVGGSGPRSAERVARANGWFPSLSAAQTVAPSVERVRQRAEQDGRGRPLVVVGGHAALGPDAAERAPALRASLAGMGLSDADLAAVPITGTAEQVADQLATYREVGADRMTLSLDGADWAGQVAVLAHARDDLDRVA